MALNHRLSITRFFLLVSMAGMALSASAESLLETIRGSVREKWSAVSERCGKVSELRREKKDLSDSILTKPVKILKDKQIAHEIDKIRAAMLSHDAVQVLAAVDEIDRKAETLRVKMSKLMEEREFFPERKEKIDENIATIRSELETLNAKREAELGRVKEELAQIGLKMEGKAGDNLFALITKRDIIDNVIVSKSVSEIVVRLQAVMSGGDIASAKRYFGVYLTLTEINIRCHEEYLDKSRNGEWRKRLEALEGETRERVKTTERNAADERFNEKQRMAFRKNLEMSNALLAAIDLYKKLLTSQEQVIEKRLVELRKVHELAQDSYATVSAASEFLSLMQSGLDDFAAILDMNVPELEVVPDLAVQEQLQSITKMLDK